MALSIALEHIENKNLNLEASACYAAILGESPSKGARSPTLWNAAFKGLKLPAMMHPMDIRKENLKSVVGSLRQDKRFIGGAVTMPYKIEIMPFLDALEPEAEIIGAVNCIYRKDGGLVGANTDGAGALWSLQNTYGDLRGKGVLLLGVGGAGFAVAAYVANALGKNGTLRLANRSPGPLQILASRLQGACQIQTIAHWPVTPEDVAGVDVLVNCTSIGFANHKEEALRMASPVSRQVLINMQSSLVYDIIYQPLETELLREAKQCGHKTLNGLAMNLEQAVIAFEKVNQAVGLWQGSRDDVRALMKEAAQ